MVPMFPIAAPGAATITGKVTAELDLTNTAPEPAPNVTVTAKVDVDDPDFVSRYITPTQGTTNSNAGRIIKYAFQDAIISTHTDVQGNYTLQVPAALNGLPVKLSVADYQTTQKLYLENNPADGTFKPGEYTVPVLFSSNVEPSPIPEVKPVYVVVDEPTAPIGITYKFASFTFELDANGGFSKVTVLNKGFFSAKPLIGIYGKGYGKGAELEPIFNTTTGEIDDVKIVSPGSGYNTSNYILSTKLTQVRRTAKLDFLIESDGSIYKTNIVDKGTGYVDVPHITIIKFHDDELEPIIKPVMNYWKDEISMIELIRPGKNFNKCMNLQNAYSLDNLNIKCENILCGTNIIKNIGLGTGKR